MLLERSFLFSPRLVPLDVIRAKAKGETKERERDETREMNRRKGNGNVI